MNFHPENPEELYFVHHVFVVSYAPRIQPHAALFVNPKPRTIPARDIGNKTAGGRAASRQLAPPCGRTGVTSVL
jgi:hypothetical protein